MVLAISAPADNKRGAVYCEQVLAALHQANPQRLPMTFIVGRHEQTAGLYCRIPVELAGTFRHQFTARYHDCDVTELSDEAFAPPDRETISLDLRLRPDVFPMLRYQQFEDAVERTTADPLSGLLGAVARQGRGDARTLIEITVRPARRRRCRQARRVVEILNAPFLRSHRGLAHAFAVTASRSRALCLLASLAGLISRSRPYHDPLATSPNRLHDREDELQAAQAKVARGSHLFETRIRIMAVAFPGKRRHAKAVLRDVAAAFAQFNGLATFHIARFRPRRTFLLSDEELATLWHPPIDSVQTPSMTRSAYRRLEPPANVPLKETDQAPLTELGRVTYQNRGDVFGLREEDRLRHLAIIGKTGMGKSTLLLNVIVSDLRSGHGLALIDPHGDLAERVLALVPRNRTNDVVLIDPADTAHPVGFNPLDVPRAQAQFASDGIVSTFRKLFDTGTHTPRLEDILWNTVLALVHAGGTTLLDILPMLRALPGGDAARETVLARVHDPVLRDWWRTEFPLLVQSRDDPFASVKNKVRKLLTTPVVRNIIAQTENRIDFRRMMDEGRVVIVNVSRGRLGDTTSSFLGALLVTQFQLAAMSRADVPEHERRSFHLYVDEFQNFATQSFATILSEARKYRLGLTIANQFLDQMERGTAAAVFGNVGSLIAFQCGAADAEFLSEQFAGKVKGDDLIALPPHHAYVRLHATPERPFSMETLPPPHVHPMTKRPQKIQRASRRRYARPAELVEREIARVFAYA